MYNSAKCMAWGNVEAKKAAGVTKYWGNYDQAAKICVLEIGGRGVVGDSVEGCREPVRILPSLSSRWCGCGKAFEGVARGDEIVPRLLNVYHATKEGWVTKEGYDAYFIVRRPPLIASKELEGLAHQHLEKIRQIAVAGDHQELANLLESGPNIEIKEGEAFSPSALESPEIMIHETVGDWFFSLKPASSDAELMREAFYTIACDYDLARYLMWPWHRDCTTIEEPFEPYFQLWRHGMTICFSRPGLVTVCRAR
jgi:hypothetical protein